MRNHKSHPNENHNQTGGGNHIEVVLEFLTASFDRLVDREKKATSTIPSTITTSTTSETTVTGIHHHGNDANHNTTTIGPKPNTTTIEPNTTTIEPNTTTTTGLNTTTTGLNATIAGLNGTATGLNTTTPGPPPSGGTSTNVKLAIAIPVVVVGLAILLGVIWIVTRRKRRNKTRQRSFHIAGHQTTTSTLVPEPPTSQTMTAPKLATPDFAATPSLRLPGLSQSREPNPAAVSGQNTSQTAATFQSTTAARNDDDDAVSDVSDNENVNDDMSSVSSFESPRSATARHFPSVNPS